MSWRHRNVYEWHSLVSSPLHDPDAVFHTNGPGYSPKLEYHRYSRYPAQLGRSFRAQ